jgi:hypothetical protein
MECVVVAVAKLGPWLVLLMIVGHRPAWGQDAAAVARCAEPDVTARLASLHPLGAAATEGAQCLDDKIRWAPVTPMSAVQRRVWADAIDSLWAIQLPECWAGAAVLIHLDQNDLVRTWAPVDTAAGRLYVGAAYLSPRAEPLGVQFWARVFDRPLPQLIAVLLHEAYHVIAPSASESEASAFGRPCSSTPSS